MFSCARPYRVVLAGAVVCLGAMCPAAADAQSRVRQVARRDSEDLSRFLIENESRTNRLERTQTPVFDRAGTLDVSRTDMGTLRRLLSRFADDMSRLYQQLDVESDRNPRLRSVLSDALKLRARSALLAEDAGTARDARAIATSLRELDRDWRLLSFNIKALPAVARTTLALVSTLDQTEAQLAAAVSMKPQLDRRELVKLVMAMRADLDNLLDDIQLELGDTDKARELTRKVRSIRQQAVYAADLVSEGEDYERIVEAYQRAESEWRPVARDLMELNNRYIDRSVRRIVAIGNQMKELLWLEQGIDRGQLIEVATSLKQDVDEFFRRTPLLLILKLDDPNAAIDAANYFLDAAEVYTDQVRLGEDETVLAEVYRDLEVTGRDFVNVFDGMPSRAGQLVLNDIRRDLATLRELASSHNTGDSLDMPRASELAAEMDMLAEHVEFDLNHWLQNSNEPFKPAALRASQQLRESTRRLSAAFQARATRDQLEKLTTAVYRDWREVNQYLDRAPREDREHLLSVANKMTSALYDLMLPLGL